MLLVPFVADSEVILQLPGDAIRESGLNLPRNGDGHRVGPIPERPRRISPVAAMLRTMRPAHPIRCSKEAFLTQRSREKAPRSRRKTSIALRAMHDQPRCHSPSFSATSVPSSRFSVLKNFLAYLRGAPCLGRRRPRAPAGSRHVDKAPRRSPRIAGDADPASRHCEAPGNTAISRSRPPQNDRLDTLGRR